MACHPHVATVCKISEIASLNTADPGFPEARFKQYSGSRKMRVMQYENRVAGCQRSNVAFSKIIPERPREEACAIFQKVLFTILGRRFSCKFVRCDRQRRRSRNSGMCRQEAVL